MPEPVFEVYKDNAGKFRFRLKAANGEVIAVGEAYQSKQGCLDGIALVKESASTAVIAEAWKKPPSKPFKKREE